MLRFMLIVITTLFFIFIAHFSIQAKNLPNTKKIILKKNITHNRCIKKNSNSILLKQTTSKFFPNHYIKKIQKVLINQNKCRIIKQRISMSPIISSMSVRNMIGLRFTQNSLALKSKVALVIDQSNSQVLFEKNAALPLPIASVTKLMTSLIVVESRQNMKEILTITNDDIDRKKYSSSRLRIGTQLSRDDMLHIALMSSENRAASALGRNYPGGLSSFVVAMNAKARSLGMMDTHYVDSTGLSSRNVSNARDLARLVVAAYNYSIIRRYSTNTKYIIELSGRALQYASSNRLVTRKDWDIRLQKTGYINEAGHCLVMLTKIKNRPVVMIFLDSKGKLSHVGDATRIRKWLFNCCNNKQYNTIHVNMICAKNYTKNF